VKDIAAYHTKETFGDLDVLVETFFGDQIDYMEFIKTEFEPKQIVHNSHVYSFDYMDFQVDLILTPTEDYDTSMSYYSWNDLGNLAGRIYKKLGFKYGHKGLSYMFRKDDETYSVYGEVVVSRDIKQILEFGDLNYDQFMAGFSTINEMFLWVSASKYFHKDIYLLHNRNHTSRTRDKKRKIYNAFLTWCETAPNLPTYPWTEMREQDGYAGKPEFLKLALSQFDGFQEVHDRVQLDYKNDLTARAKFNGDVVAALTGTSGKDLGMFMQHFIKVHGGKDKCWATVLALTSSDIDTLIVAEYNRFIA
jgi:hypothetical protein